MVMNSNLEIGNAGVHKISKAVKLFSMINLIDHLDHPEVFRLVRIRGG